MSFSRDLENSFRANANHELALPMEKTSRSLTILWIIFHFLQMQKEKFYQTAKMKKKKTQTIEALNAWTLLV